MIEIAYWLWETNPLAGWLVDVTTAFILAEGIPYDAKHEDKGGFGRILARSMVNRMPLYFPKHVNELQIYGELCLPVFTAQQTGRTRYGYIDPANIDQVITDPDNVRMVIGVLTKGWTGMVDRGYTVTSDPKKYMTILLEDADYLLSPKAKWLREQFTDGGVFLLVY